MWKVFQLGIIVYVTHWYVANNIASNEPIGIIVLFGVFLAYTATAALTTLFDALLLLRRWAKRWELLG